MNFVTLYLFQIMFLSSIIKIATHGSQMRRFGVLMGVLDSQLSVKILVVSFSVNYQLTF